MDKSYKGRRDFPGALGRCVQWVCCKFQFVGEVNMSR